MDATFTTPSSGLTGGPAGDLDGEHGPGQVEDGANVEVEHRVDLGGLLFGEDAALPATGVVDEQVDGVEYTGTVLGEAFDDRGETSGSPRSATSTSTEVP